MHYYVYVLLSTKDSRLYIGVTNNLKQRLQQHARGRVASKRRYLNLIHYEYFVNKRDSRAREVFLKSGAGHEQLKQILKNTLQ